MLIVLGRDFVESDQVAMEMPGLRAKRSPSQERMALICIISAAPAPLIESGSPRSGDPPANFPILPW